MRYILPKFIPLAKSLEADGLSAFEKMKAALEERVGKAQDERTRDQAKRDLQDFVGVKRPKKSAA